MDNLQHEQYEYARNRIRQKKNVFRHFLLLLVGSLFLFIVNKILAVDKADDWYAWVITAWAFLFVLHFLKVFITDSFMNKNWERHQIDKLVSMQQKKMQKLQAQLDAERQQETDAAQNQNP
ncbi:2TM domain-containing protein [Flavobacterium longum]|uniref:2TM domain-containing protein n=1 Tax=Flavobacterium longum TaxID=1299340 RepID=UPI0039EB340F